MTGTALAFANEAFALLGTGRQVAPFSARTGAFALTDAYDIVARVAALRQARGETPVGRKIGFTNEAVWTGYGISGPIWNYMFDTTVLDASALRTGLPLAGFAEPRIEPEIVLHLAKAPSANMDEDDLIGCIDWVAPAFEIVHSIFPGWSFTAADGAAAFGLHGALLLGEHIELCADRERSHRLLSNFTVEMTRGDGMCVQGHARNVLGGPVKALRFLVRELARHGSEPLHAGELVTTGTLTEAMPARAGDSWSMRFTGIDAGCAPVRLR